LGQVCRGAARQIALLSLPIAASRGRANGRNSKPSGAPEGLMN